MIIRDSIPVLLEMARVDYQLNGQVTPMISFLLVGEEPRQTRKVAEFYEKEFKDKRLFEYALTNENTDSVFIIYADENICLEYVAKKDLLESSFLGPWIRTEIKAKKCFHQSKILSIKSLLHSNEKIGTSKPSRF